MATETPTESPANAHDTDIALSILHRIADDLAMIVDRTLHISNAKVMRVDRRVAGKSTVHISFKLRFEKDGEQRYGALLLPLADSIALANYLMMMPDDAVSDHRRQSAPDQGTKDAILEVANFIGGAVDAVLRESLPGGARAKSGGCQGVRANVRPAFPYEEGEELLLVRASASLHEFEKFELLLMLPDVFAV